ncbi:MAG: hypothetical protein OHK0046_33900 [Anaerolineae bacterium]
MAETTSYLLLGLVIALGSTGLYGISLWLRLRNAHLERAIIDQLNNS